MPGVLKYFGHFYEFCVKRKKTLHAVKVLLLLLLDMYHPVRWNINKCLKNNYILNYSQIK